MGHRIIIEVDTHRAPDRDIIKRGLSALITIWAKTYNLVDQGHYPHIKFRNSRDFKVVRK